MRKKKTLKVNDFRNSFQSCNGSRPTCRLPNNAVTLCRFTCKKDQHFACWCTMINWNIWKCLTNKSRKFHSTGWHIRAKNCPLVLLNDVVNLIYERCAAAVQRRAKTKSGAGFKWRAKIHAKQKLFLTSSIFILANCRFPISAIVCIGKNMACWAEKHTVSMTFRISDSFNSDYFGMFWLAFEGCEWFDLLSAHQECLQILQEFSRKLRWPIPPLYHITRQATMTVEMTFHILLY